MVNDDTKLSFLGFGTMNGKDGKPFKTRDGGVLQLNDLINQVKDELDKKMTNFENEDEKKKIINILACATIKYADLLPFRTTDYIFDPIKFVVFSFKSVVATLTSLGLGVAYRLWIFLFFNTSTTLVLYLFERRTIASQFS